MIGMILRVRGRCCPDYYCGEETSGGTILFAFTPARAPPEVIRDGASAPPGPSREYRHLLVSFPIAATERVSGTANGNCGNLGFEAQLFLAADKLRKNLEPSDYKHVAIGLIFLKYISNAFESKGAALLAEDAAAAEDPGAEDGALVTPASQRQTTHHRQADRRGDGRNRESKPQPQGRAAQGL
jgi:hypothetical protein